MSYAEQLICMAEFVHLVELAQFISRSDKLTWEEKFDLIFSDRISGAIHRTGIEFEYYNPDTTHQEDVCAYIKAVSSKADRLSAVLKDWRGR